MIFLFESTDLSEFSYHIHELCMKASEGGSEGIITISTLPTRRPRFIQVSVWPGLHTVKPGHFPRASKSTATPFPEPEEAPELQLCIS